LIKEKGFKNIVIVGGSHSGFSSAWLLLNGPALYYCNSGPVTMTQKPRAMKKTVKNCQDCCTCTKEHPIKTVKKTVSKKVDVPISPAATPVC